MLDPSSVNAPFLIDIAPGDFRMQAFALVRRADVAKIHAQRLAHPFALSDVERLAQPPVNAAVGAVADRHAVRFAVRERGHHTFFGTHLFVTSQRLHGSAPSLERDRK